LFLLSATRYFLAIQVLDSFFWELYALFTHHFDRQPTEGELSPVCFLVVLTIAQTPLSVFINANNIDAPERHSQRTKCGSKLSLSVRSITSPLETEATILRA
jgi:hypothetical protein